jgi:hypothetical protein
MRYSDSLTFTGANKLADQIRHYWRVRGYSVEVIVEDSSSPHRDNIWCVRSNMVNGHPQRKLVRH